MERDAFGNESAAPRGSVAPPGSVRPDLAPSELTGRPDDNTVGVHPGQRLPAWLDRLLAPLRRLPTLADGNFAIKGELGPEMRRGLGTVLGAEDLAKLERGESIRLDGPGFQQVQAVLDGLAAAGPSMTLAGTLSPEERLRLATVLSAEDIARLERGEAIHLADHAAMQQVQALIAEIGTGRSLPT